MKPIKKNIVSLALYAGEIMLKNGGETYRVEDTIVRICKAYDIAHVESFVTPTGIFISIQEEEESGTVSFLKRIATRTVDLNKISQVNDFSRKISTNHLSIEEGIHILNEIDGSPKYSKFLKLICAGLASSFYGILLGSTFYDFISSFFISMLIYASVSFIANLDSNLFIQNVIGGAVAAFLSILSVTIGVGINVDKMIIGSIMILVPGVAITNAVRDSIAGDLLAGVARMAEAFIIAISIAVGVGVVMNIWIHIFGGIS